MRVCPSQPLGEHLRDVAVALLCPDSRLDDVRWLSSRISELERSSTVGVFLLRADASIARKMLTDRRGQFLCVDEETSPEELSAKLWAATSLQPAIRNLRRELSAARMISPGSAEVFEDLDEEMRLAARLQRDFLPRRLPEVARARFGVLYHPAGWLSGDIYDVARLDETHVGFYVVDAVGHGMPAALLTMFIKKALQTKRIVGKSYQIVPPHVSLEELNIDICEQNLNSCHFCTAVYGVLDVSTLVLTYCRAGHPEPVLCRDDGTFETLDAPGSLLGILHGERFESSQVQLAPGDRLVLYTDGVESCLRHPDASAGNIPEIFARWADVRREEMLLELTARLDMLRGQEPADDVTVLVMDVGR